MVIVFFSKNKNLVIQKRFKAQEKNYCADAIKNSPRWQFIAQSDNTGSVWLYPPEVCRAKFLDSYFAPGCKVLIPAQGVFLDLKKLLDSYSCYTPVLFFEKSEVTSAEKKKKIKRNCEQTPHSLLICI